MKHITNFNPAKEFATGNKSLGNTRLYTQGSTTQSYAGTPRVSTAHISSRTRSTRGMLMRCCAWAKHAPQESLCTEILQHISRWCYLYYGDITLQSKQTRLAKGEGRNKDSECWKSFLQGHSRSSEKPRTAFLRFPVYRSNAFCWIIMLLSVSADQNSSTLCSLCIVVNNYTMCRATYATARESIKISLILALTVSEKQIPNSCQLSLF